jgi:hypothetical protein
VAALAVVLPFFVIETIASKNSSPASLSGVVSLHARAASSWAFHALKFNFWPLMAMKKGIRRVPWFDERRYFAVEATRGEKGWQGLPRHCLKV